MPIYDYQCNKCHKTWDTLKKSYKDADNEVCPDCGESAERLISKTGFRMAPEEWLADAANVVERSN